MKSAAERSVRRDVPRLLAEMFRRLSPVERLELAKHLSWQELEEWKATEETLNDKRLMARIRRGVKDEARGRLRRVPLGRG